MFPMLMNKNCSLTASVRHEMNPASSGSISGHKFIQPWSKGWVAVALGKYD